MSDQPSPNLLQLFLSQGLSGLLRANLAPEALIAWFQDPATQSALASLHALAESAATLRLAQARFTAIQTLDQLSATAPAQKDRRLAATTLHRANPSRREGQGWVRSAPDNKKPGAQSDNSSTPPLLNPKPKTTNAPFPRKGAPG